VAEFGPFGAILIGRDGGLRPGLYAQGMAAGWVTDAHPAGAVLPSSIRPNSCRNITVSASATTCGAHQLSVSVRWQNCSTGGSTISCDRKR